MRYINLLLSNAKFEEPTPIVARTLYQKLVEKLPKVMEVSIEYARFEADEKNEDKSIEVLKKLLGLLTPDLALFVKK